MTTLGVACVVFVVPPQKLPPALQSIDAFGPLMARWCRLPVQVILMVLGLIIHMHVLVGSILMGGRILVYILAYFGVLMMAAPACHEEAVALATSKPSATQPPQVAAAIRRKAGVIRRKVATIRRKAELPAARWRLSAARRRLPAARRQRLSATR